MIPGPHSKRLARRLRAVESANITYVSNRFPIFWKSASGATVTDVDGNRFLDLTSAFGVASLGHSPNAVQKAAIQQLKTLWHGMGDVHPSAVKIELLELLKSVTPGNLSVSILSNSGAEAVESALKTARLATGRPEVIAFEGAYHGLSYGTLPVTDRTEFSKPFADQLPRISTRCPFPDPLRGVSEAASLEYVEGILKMNKWVGAILTEPFQGRGGVRIPSPSFLRHLRRLAKRYGCLLIVDEIWTGFGRTGKDFGVDYSDVVPDILCLGKALTNGFPLSVCIGTPAVMKHWPLSDGEAIHTSTFLGNPLGCAMAVASIQEWKKQKLSDRSFKLGAWWLEHLEAELGDHPNVGDIRGQGLMIGIELVTNQRTNEPHSKLAGDLIQRALTKERLLILSSGKGRNVISLTPPLTITEKELRDATSRLKRLLYV